MAAALATEPETAMKRSILVLLVVLSWTLAGCGGGSSSLSGLSTDALLKKARVQVASAKYVRVAGKIQQSGQATSIDLRYVGNDSYGTIVLAGATMQIESVGGTTYFKPSADFWKQQLSANEASVVTKIIGGRWIVADPSNASFAQLVAVAKRTFLTKEVLTPSSTVTKGAVTTVGGTKAIPLSVKTGKLYLDDATARPLQVTGSGSGGSGTATFSYDSFAAPIAPAAKDRVDLSKLLSGK